jgi:chromate transporter
MSAPSSTPSLLALVSLFARVGATAFGGGVTSHLLQHFLCRGWLTEREYLEAVNWCQNLPGPNATNLSAYMGFRFKGVRGALFATIALVLPGAVMVLALNQAILRLPQAHLTRGALDAVAAAAVGLLLGMVWQLAKPALTDRLRWAVAVATSALVAGFGVPTPVVIVVMVAIGLGWDRHREAAHDRAD